MKRGVNHLIVLESTFCDNVAISKQPSHIPDSALVTHCYSLCPRKWYTKLSPVRRGSSL